MSTYPDDAPIEQKLSAFADGELDATHSGEMMEYVAAHPEALQWALDQQRLSLAARRVFAPPDAKVPASLREKLQRLDGTPAVAAAAGTPTSSAFFRRFATALAACLLIALGVVIARITSPSNSIPSPAVASPVVPASIVAHASRVHADCSRLAEALHAAGYPQQQGQLAANVERDLHSDRPFPNLTSIGFRYVGAGPCGDPLPNTIHLLYHGIAAGSPQAISVFVQSNQGQFPLSEGKIYNIAGPDSPFPMLCWRTDSVIYFLIADNERLEDRALSVIRSDTFLATPAATATSP